MINNPDWVSGYTIAENADLLLHDSQYSQDEYPSKTGWGHSSMDDTLHFASMAKVKRVLLAHHDPMHTDKQLNELFSDLKKRNNYNFSYELAAEGMEIEI
jgi:ribonuclease BN (tRNA processing enzyme)